LNPDRELVIQWQWRPRPPLPSSEALPQRTARQPELFAPISGSDAEWAAYRFNFAQLAKMTPDLRLYRLVRLFNTPLSTMSTREAGHAGWAYWQGHVQAITPVAGGEACAHLWFFDDGRDGDTVVLEYGFDAQLSLRTLVKPREQLDKRLREIAARVHAPDAGLTESRVRVP
jgi:hypothetical protein